MPHKGLSDDAYRCPHCGHWSVVPSLNTQHADTCAANPNPLNHETGHQQPQAANTGQHTNDGPSS